MVLVSLLVFTAFFEVTYTPSMIARIVATFAAKLRNFNDRNIRKSFARNIKIRLLPFKHRNCIKTKKKGVERLSKRNIYHHFSIEFLRMKRISAYQRDYPNNYTAGVSADTRYVETSNEIP